MSKVSRLASGNWCPIEWDFPSKFRVAEYFVFGTLVSLGIFEIEGVELLHWTAINPYVPATSFLGMWLASWAIDSYFWRGSGKTRCVRAWAEVTCEDLQWRANAGYLALKGSTLVYQSKSEYMILPAGSAEVQLTHWNSAGPKFRIEQALGSITVTVEPHPATLKGRQALEALVAEWAAFGSEEGSQVAKVSESILKRSRGFWTLDRPQILGLVLLVLDIGVIVLLFAKGWILAGSAVEAILLLIVGILLLRSSKRDFTTLIGTGQA